MNLKKLIVKNQKGISLIEVVVTIVILSMISSILYGFLFLSVTMYKRISFESQLQAQADNFFTQLTTELSESVFVRKEGTNIILTKKVSERATPSSPDTTYIKQYQIVFNNNNVTLVNTENTAETFRIAELTTDKFVLFRTDVETDSRYAERSRIEFVNNNLIRVVLTFEANDASELNANVSTNEKKILRVDTQIPLYRSE